MVSEITVTVRNDEKKLSHKYLVYETVTTSDTDPIIKDCISKSLAAFVDEYDKIKVKINLLVN